MGSADQELDAPVDTKRRIVDVMGELEKVFIVNGPAEHAALIDTHGPGVGIISRKYLGVLASQHPELDRYLTATTIPAHLLPKNQQNGAEVDPNAQVSGPGYFGCGVRRAADAFLFKITVDPETGDIHLEILLGLRKDNGRLALPGGKEETPDNGDLHKTALRETEEETLIKLAVLPELNQSGLLIDGLKVFTRYPVKDDRNTSWSCIVSDGYVFAAENWPEIDLNSRELDGFFHLRWFGCDTVAQLTEEIRKQYLFSQEENVEGNSIFHAGHDDLIKKALDLVRSKISELQASRKAENKAPQTTDDSLPSPPTSRRGRPPGVPRR